MEENFIEKLINNLGQDKELCGDSTNWANWMSMLAFNTCKYCVEQHGKIVEVFVFANSSAKLPSALGRVWYEADINYGGGKRNRQRIVYSNDGLMFATYDHYQTFYEITQ